jgi:tol-pal system protein YbgF
LAGFASQPALAQQDLRPLLDRVQRMERDVSTLQQQVYGGKPPSATPAQDTEATAAATVRMSQIESDLRATTGQIEEINFNVGQLRQRLDRLVTDVDFRLQQLEKIAAGGAPAAGVVPPVAGGVAPAAPEASPAAIGAVPPGAGAPGIGPAGIGSAGAAVPPAASASADSGAEPTVIMGAPPRNLGTIPSSIDRALPSAYPAAPPPAQTAAAPGAIAPTALSPGMSAPAASVHMPAGSPKDQYDYAFDLLKRAEYAEAEQALRQFIGAYPHDPLAGNAQYWLGETYYVRNNYSEAAAQFLKGYQTYPQSPKAPDNLFKLGLTLTILGKVQEACTAYQRFDREYAGAPGALKRRVTDERQRLGCS